MIRCNLMFRRVWTLLVAMFLIVGKSSPGWTSQATTVNAYHGHVLDQHDYDDISRSSSFSVPWQLTENNVKKALNRIREILQHEKEQPIALVDPSDDHTYDDKFAMVELVTQMTWKMLLDALGKDGLGLMLTQESMLYMEMMSTCEFLYEKQDKKVVGGGKETIDAHGTVTSTERNVQYVTHYYWNVTVSYHLYTCTDSHDCHDPDSAGQRRTLQTRSASALWTTASKTAPRPERKKYTSELNLTQWINFFNTNKATTTTTTTSKEEQLFTIQRSSKACKTPRRNPDVEKALNLHLKIFKWCQQVLRDFYSLFGESKQLDELTNTDVPVLAIPVLLENSTLPSLLAKSLRDIQDTMPEPAPDVLVSLQEGRLLRVLSHICNLILAHSESVQFIENLLRRQLVQAIGKLLTASDFSEYMLFHNRKFFGDQYLPTPFSRSVRRPNQYPVGVVSIETDTPDGASQPIFTVTRKIPGSDINPIRIPIDAATNVEITGDRFLSGWIRYDFASEPSPQITLAARAKQFSSFLLLIGTMTGPDSFDPKHAIILKNKDDVRIALETQVLPSAKEFKDAIKSLSPEQQDFARAFRAMQLESSVFGVCIIQLKPQLEKLLNLPEGALMKEIELTEAITTLFIDYQISSDLLSYDGPSTADVSEKVTVVAGYVEGVMNVIEARKEMHMREEKQRGETMRYMNYGGPIDFGQDSSSFAATTAPSSAPSSVHARKSRSARALYTTSAVPESNPHVRRPKSQTTESSQGSDDASTSEPPKSARRDSSPLNKSTDDFTLIPKLLDEKLENYDTDGSLRSMIIKAGNFWRRKRQENLLVAPEEEVVHTDDISQEKKAAYDLLDAISRSGTLSIASSELHVIVGMAHCFDQSLMATVIEDNINPISKAEQSLLMIASTIYNEPPVKLIHESIPTEKLDTHFARLSPVPDDIIGDANTDKVLNEI